MSTIREEKEIAEALYYASSVHEERRPMKPNPPLWYQIIKDLLYFALIAYGIYSGNVHLSLARKENNTHQQQVVGTGPTSSLAGPTKLPDFHEKKPSNATPAKQLP